VVTTLHGTDTTLLGRDAGYRPAIRHALMQSDAVTTVSAWLRDETKRLLEYDKPIEVIHNFYAPREPKRSVAEVRKELGLTPAQVLVLHASNLRPVKRIDLLLESVARVKPRNSFKLVILAGGDFSPFKEQVRRLGLEKTVVVRENVTLIEDYLHAADLGLFTSETESFCLSLLETMWFGRPSVATAVGGIPEVVRNGESGVLVPAGDADALARAVEGLIADKTTRATIGKAAQQRARGTFSAEQIVPLYEQLYRRVVAGVRL
jgi:N-acetyl-alpha-D-glucosaminyl L-malate synthase BshA